MHPSATILKPLRGEVINIDHLGTIQCSIGRLWSLEFMVMHTAPQQNAKQTTPPQCYSLHLPVVLMLLLVG